MAGGWGERERGRQGRELPRGSLPQHLRQASRAALGAAPGPVAACGLPGEPLPQRRAWGRAGKSNVRGQGGPRPGWAEASRPLGPGPGPGPELRCAPRLGAESARADASQEAFRGSCSQLGAFTQSRPGLHSRTWVRADLEHRQGSHTWLDAEPAGSRQSLPRAPGAPTAA